MDILIIVKLIALAYKKGEGSSQAQGEIPLRAALNDAWLDPSVRLYAVAIYFMITKYI
jgi:hypothetical protein